MADAQSLLTQLIFLLLPESLKREERPFDGPFDGESAHIKIKEPTGKGFFRVKPQENPFLSEKEPFRTNTERGQHTHTLHCFTVCPVLTEYTHTCP